MLLRATLEEDIDEYAKIDGRWWLYLGSLWYSV